MDGKARRGWLSVLVWVVGIAGVALIARGLNWARVGEAVRKADGPLLAVAGLLALLALVLQAVRWHQVIQPVRKVRLRTVVAASLAGQAASCVLPLRAGEAVRLELLARASGMSRAAALGTVAADHTVNGSVMFLLAGLLPFVLPVPAAARAAVWGGFAAILVVAIVLLRAAWPADGREPQGRIGKQLAKLREGLAALRSPRAVLVAVGASAAAWCCEVLAAAAALQAFGVHHGGVAGGAAVIFGVNLAMAAPAPPANLGTFELGAAMALMALGEAADAAAAFALGYHALLLLPMVIGGGLSLLGLRRLPKLDASFSAA